MLKNIFKPIIDWYLVHVNYFTITLLMTIESSFIPFPSEVVVPPAAWKAAGGELNLILVILFATLGAILGALLNYYLAYFLGRKIIYKLADTKIAHLLLINREGVEKSEKFFLKYGSVATLAGRLLPGIRQLVSIPAGLARMHLGKFLLYTTIGAGIWNVILALLGYFLYSQKELLDRYYHEVSVILIIAGIAVILFFVIKWFITRKKKTDQPKEETPVE